MVKLYSRNIVTAVGKILGFLYSQILQFLGKLY